MVGRARSGIGGTLFIVGQLAMLVYLLISLYAYATNLGAGWLIGSIIVLPLSFLYPIVSAWKLDVFPIVLAALGFGAFALIAIGSQIAEIEPPEQDRYGY